MIRATYIVSGFNGYKYVNGTVTLQYDGYHTTCEYSGSVYGSDKSVVCPAYSLHETMKTTTIVQGKSFAGPPYFELLQPLSKTTFHFRDWIPQIHAFFKIPPFLTKKAGDKGNLFNMQYELPKAHRPIVGTYSVDGANNLLSFTGTQYKETFQFKYSNYSLVGKAAIPGDLSETVLYDGRTASNFKWILTGSTSKPGKISLSKFVGKTSYIQDNRDPNYGVAYTLTSILGKNGDIDLSKMNHTRQFSAQRNIEVSRAKIAGYVAIILLVVIGGFFGAKVMKTRLKSKSKTQAGFTMIELLVVISIIAILAAILFPVLAKARLKGYETSAISREGQVSIALSMYIKDSDGQYPLGSTTLPSPGNPVPGTNPALFWPTFVTPYVTSAPLPHRGPYGQVIIDDLNPIFFDQIKTGFSELHKNYIDTGWDVSFGINDVIEREYGTFHGFGGDTPINESSIAYPSSCLQLVETKPGSVGLDQQPGMDYHAHRPGAYVATPPLWTSMGFDPDEDAVDAPYPSGNPWTMVTQEHAFSVCTFCDGHTKPMPSAEVVLDCKIWSATGSSKVP